MGPPVPSTSGWLQWVSVWKKWQKSSPKMIRKIWQYYAKLWHKSLGSEIYCIWKKFQGKPTKKSTHVKSPPYFILKWDLSPITHEPMLPLTHHHMGEGYSPTWGGSPPLKKWTQKYDIISFGFNWANLVKVYIAFANCSKVNQKKI